MMGGCHFRCSALEDSKRHEADKATNSRMVQRVGRMHETEELYDVKWKNVEVGDIVRIVNGKELPADVVLLTTSEESGIGQWDFLNIFMVPNRCVHVCTTSQ
jgi:magnesium-transporting ATPase (P-type)